MTDKVKATALILGAAAFALFGVWDISVPIDETVFNQLVDLIFIIIGGFGIFVGGKLASK